MARILITSALPYINGIKHLGNLVGSMLPADVYSRFKRQQGHEVLYICATDEHGTPAELAARAAGQDVANYCREQHDIQKKAGAEFGLSFDHFGRSSNPPNHRLTQHFAHAHWSVEISRGQHLGGEIEEFRRVGRGGLASQDKISHHLLGRPNTAARSGLRARQC